MLRKRDELVRMAADIFVHSGKTAGDELSREEFDDLLHSEAREADGEGKLELSDSETGCF